jgi:hypothetical protein
MSKRPLEPAVLMEIRYFANLIENAAIQAYAGNRDHLKYLRMFFKNALACVRALNKKDEMKGEPTGEPKWELKSVQEGELNDCPWPLVDGECKPPVEP